MSFYLSQGNTSRNVENASVGKIETKKDGSRIMRTDNLVVREGDSINLTYETAEGETKIATLPVKSDVYQRNRGYHVELPEDLILPDRTCLYFLTGKTINCVASSHRKLIQKFL